MLKNLLATGSGSRIYTLSSEEVVKVRLPLEYQPSIFREYEIAKALFDEEISVPEPYGIIEVHAPDIGKSLGFKMQRIYGITDSKMPQLKDILDEELQKCRDKGFKPVDEGLSNTIYDFIKDRLFLIDFEHWGN